MAKRPFGSTPPRCHLAGAERRSCIRLPWKEVWPTQPALLVQYQVALWSRTFGENRPDLALELMTRFPIGKGARMIRPVLAQSYPLIVSRSYCYRHRNGFQWSAVSSSAAPSLVRSICSASSASFRRRSLCDDCGGASCGGSLHGHTLHGGHDRPRCLPLDRWHHGRPERPSLKQNGAKYRRTH